MANKVLSIIIPTYNMEKYLRKCLESLIVAPELMQMLEVLVVNDGSKDSSSQIAHEYQEKYPNTFRVIDKENGNYGSCINRGLKEATGKYVKVLDADDSFDIKNFEKYLSKLSELDVDMVISDYAIVNEQGETTRVVSRATKPQTVLPIEDLIDDLLYAPEIQMHAVAYRTKNLIQINYTQLEGISYTDQEWMFLPVTTVKTVYYFPQIVYKYLVGRAGQTVEEMAAIRNIQHHHKRLARQIQQYKDFDHNNIMDRYLRDRLIGGLRSTYFRYLISYRKLLTIEDLIVLDKTLSSVPVLYLGLEKAAVFHGVKYVKMWHKSPDAKVPIKLILLSDLYTVVTKYRR